MVAAAILAAAPAAGQPGAARGGPAPVSTFAPYDHLTPPPANQLVAPPPVYGSPAMLLDAQLFLQTRRIEETDPGRWAQARRDADDRPEALLAGFAPALGGSALGGSGVAPGPATLRLVGRERAYVAAALAPVQRAFRRVRPYRHNHQSICVPRFTSLDRSPSYPSVLSAEAMATALLLGELVPDRLGALLVRARAYGESRVICGVHWASDVAAGQQAGAALFALLQTNAEFQADLTRARQEMAGQAAKR